MTAVSAKVRVAADDPVFAGHYPGFPILPGLLLVEEANGVVRAELDSPHLCPSAVEKVRFLRPVYPGDEVSIECEIDRGTDAIRCSARIFVESTAVAEIRLRYRTGEGVTGS